MNHTPTPWTQDIYGNVVPPAGYGTLLLSGFSLTTGNHPRQKEAEANAAFIVRACNAHDELVAALTAIREYSPHIRPLEMQNIARAALAKVQA